MGVSTGDGLGIDGGTDRWSDEWRDGQSDRLGDGWRNHGLESNRLGDRRRDGWRIGQRD